MVCSLSSLSIILNLRVNFKSISKKRRKPLGFPAPVGSLSWFRFPVQDDHRGKDQQDAEAGEQGQGLGGRFSAAANFETMSAGPQISQDPAAANRKV